MVDRRPLIVDPAASPPVREMVDGDSLSVALLAQALHLPLTGLNLSDASEVTAADLLLVALGKLQAQASNKVDKVAGKGLSSNDFTNIERVRLANIAEQATKNASDAALRDRATHTGAQAIGTVSGLQAELDAKETPAGALAQIRLYGAGVNAAPYTLNLETHRIGGRFTADAATSTASGLPLPLQHTIDYLPGVNAQTGLMEASALTGNATNGGRKWMRKLNGGVWQGWRESAFLDSPVFTGSPSAPNLKIGNVPSSDVNTIDAFEKKGSFTPILRGTGVAGGFTYTQQIGRYLRLADRYLWSARLQISATDGTGTGNLQLAGFPFIALNNSAAGAGVTFGFFAGLAAGSSIQSLSAIHVQNTSFVQIYKNTGSVNPLQSLGVSDIGGAFQMYAFGVCELP